MRINDHAIKLVDDWQLPYSSIERLGPVKLEILRAYIKNNMANGFIRPFKSPARALILFNQKPDSSLKLCVDYRGLNNLTIKNRYLLPLVRELLDRLGRAQYLTQLDLTNVYQQMRIKDCNKLKTVFKTRYGHFEYQVIPFGLINTPATFQSYIKKILAKKLNVFVIKYLNYILIYTKTKDKEHVESVNGVLEQLQKHSLFDNLKKSRFHRKEVRFLDYIVSHHGIRMEEEQIEAICDWPEL